MAEGGLEVSADLRSAFCHAVVQVLADDAHAELLHIKGAALHESLRWEGRRSMDADVLVRPSDLDRLLAAVSDRGFSPVDRFVTGSPFGHSTTLRHAQWGYLDVHRSFPGFGVTPKAAFDLLWARRARVLLAGYPCHAPDLASQALIGLVHAARSRPNDRTRLDVIQAWGAADDPQRSAIDRRAVELGAEFPLAIAVGRDLEGYRARVDYDLWMNISRGGTRSAEWRSRIKAAPGMREKLRLGGRAVLPNVDAMAMHLGRRPTGREVATAAVRRWARGLSELRDVARR